MCHQCMCPQGLHCTGWTTAVQKSCGCAINACAIMDCTVQNPPIRLFSGVQVAGGEEALAATPLPPCFQAKCTGGGEPDTICLPPPPLPASSTAADQVATATDWTAHNTAIVNSQADKTAPVYSPSTAESNSSRSAAAGLVLGSGAAAGPSTAHTDMPASADAQAKDIAESSRLHISTATGTASSAPPVQAAVSNPACDDRVDTTPPVRPRLAPPCASASLEERMEFVQQQLDSLAGCMVCDGLVLKQGVHSRLQGGAHFLVLCSSSACACIAAACLTTLVS